MRNYKVILFWVLGSWVFELGVYMGITLLGFSITSTGVNISFLSFYLTVECEKDKWIVAVFFFIAAAALVKLIMMNA